MTVNSVLQPRYEAIVALTTWDHVVPLVQEVLLKVAGSEGVAVVDHEPCSLMCGQATQVKPLASLRIRAIDPGCYGEIPVDFEYNVRRTFLRAFPAEPVNPIVVRKVELTEAVQLIRPLIIPFVGGS